MSLDRSSRRWRSGGAAERGGAGPDRSRRHGYFDVLSAQDTLEFVRAEKKATARELDQAKQRFEVGLDAITRCTKRSRGTTSRSPTRSRQFRLDQTWEACGRSSPSARQPGRPDREDPAAAAVAERREPVERVGAAEQPAIQAALHAADAAKKQIEVQRSGTTDARRGRSYQVNRFQDVDTPAG